MNNLKGNLTLYTSSFKIPQCLLQVESSKKAYMENIIGFLSKCFETAYPPVLEQFLEYIKDLEFDTEPDYEVKPSRDFT